MKNDPLGTRMKEQYENRTRYSLPRRTYTILRLDGKAFHTYTKGLERPFDKDFSDAMCVATQALCNELQGVKLGYTQSDEISLLLTDFDRIDTHAWFDGNIQKMASVAASIATVAFNANRNKQGYAKPAYFDARVFTIPDQVEVMNYFIWRQKDCVRNSISMAAHSVYSHKELHNKNSADMQEMLFQKGINWNDYDSRFKRGAISFKETYPVFPTPAGDRTMRSKWSIEAAPHFDAASLQHFIPEYVYSVGHLAQEIELQK